MQNKIIQFKRKFKKEKLSLSQIYAEELKMIMQNRIDGRCSFTLKTELLANLSARRLINYLVKYFKIYNINIYVKNIQQKNRSLSMSIQFEYDR